jgi:hypothetical protein
MIVQAAADGFGMRPASHHVRDAQADEFAARIGKFLRRPKLNVLNLGLLDLCLLDLRLRRTPQSEASDNRSDRDTKKHDGLCRQQYHLRFNPAAPQRTATTIA